MTEETIKAIIRHLKGIVAELEKGLEKSRPIYYNGKLVSKLSNEKLIEAVKWGKERGVLPRIEKALQKEIKIRDITI